MDELQDRTRGTKIFTEIDLKSGYSNIRIKEGDEWKTAFQTRYGHYEYLVMPEGLTNAPASFQAMMNEILREYLDQGVVVYLDNILIYSRNEEEHEVLVKKVLQILMDNDLAGNIDKCHFHTKELNFLGYIISPEGVKMANDRVRTILDWEPPTSIKEVQMFMGFANFYRRFIPNFSGICKPITDLLKGGEQPKRRFYWTAHAQAAFEELKKRFTEALIL